MSTRRRPPPGQQSPPARLSPHDPEAEVAVLGAALQDRTALEEAAGIVGAADFYLEKHRLGFAAMLALHQRQVPPDLITLTDELRRRNHLEAVGGPAALTTLIEAVPTAANVAYHARIVKGHARRRAVWEACARAAERALVNGGPEEPLETIVADTKAALVAVDESAGGAVADRSLAQLMEIDFPPRPAHVGSGILPAQGKALLAGPGAVGKTLALLQTALELASGRAWLGRWLGDERSRVGVIMQEDPLAVIQERLRRLMRGLGLGEGADLPIFIRAPARYLRVTSDADLAEIAAFVRRHEIGVLIPDPLITFHTLNENDSAVMRYVMDRFTAVQAETGCAVLVAHHHRRRPRDGGEDPDPARGASAIQDWARTVVNLVPGRLVDGRSHIKLTFTKLNYGPMPPGPVTLERDPETLLLRVVEEQELCSPERAAQILEELGGQPRKADWYVAIQKATGCSDRTARTAAKGAIGRGWVVEGKKTGEGQPVRLAEGVSFGCGNDPLPNL